jgi:hypothetical protein
VDLNQFQGAQHFKELITITSAAAITDISGGATITAITTNTSNWYDPRGTYWLLGLSGYIAVADGAGVFQVYNMPGEWQGYRPAVVVNGLSAVTFSDDQGFTPFCEPLGPFTGEQLNQSVSMGAFLSGAVAQTKVLHFCRTG